MSGQAGARPAPGQSMAGGPGGPGGHGPGRGGPMSGLFVQPEKTKDFSGTFRRFARRLRPERIWILAVIGLAFGSVAFSVLGPKLLGNATTLIFDGFISKQMPAGASQEQVVAALRAQGQDRQADLVASIDNLIPGAGIDFTALGRALAIVAVVYLLSAILGWAQAHIMAGVTQRVIYDLRQEVDAKIGRLPLKYFDTVPRGDLLSRVTNDIDNISSTLQQVLTQLITSVLTVLGVLVIMFWISPSLALISLLTVPLSLVVTMMIAKRSRGHFTKQWMWTGKLNGHVEEMYTGHDLVKVYGRQAKAIEDFDEFNENMYQASFRAQFISGIIQPALGFISNINYVLICVIGGFRVSNGSMTLGDVQAFIQYARQFQMPITQIASVANLIQSGAASAERVFEFLDAPEEPEDAAGSHGDREVQGRFEFQDVSFQYVPDKPLIRNLNLTVEPGESVAIVGPTGAGKTTLVNLLMRFYDVDGGRILLDGIDIRDLPRNELRRSFGMVLQDTWLFGGTIRDNIAYGAAAATEEQIHAAAQAAYVDRFVKHLPEGYDTVIADDASNLSAGEKQLITIARAFLAEPEILILDEATSSVDTRTEVLIQRATGRLRTGRTSFVIAHRLSTIRDADTILVMKDGDIVEQGPHDQLIGQAGIYADLYRSQFEGVDEAAEARA